MKTVLPVLLLSFLNAYGQSKTTPAASDFKKLDWIEGTWARLDTKAGRSGHERWMRTSDTEWRGWGVSMKGSDTLFMEKLKLVIRDGAIYYVADIPGNSQPVYFKLTELTDHNFTCENPEHDFPKKISYQKKGDKLNASVSGDGKTVEYVFKKK